MQNPDLRVRIEILFRFFDKVQKAMRGIDGDGRFSVQTCLAFLQAVAVVFAVKAACPFNGQFQGLALFRTPCDVAPRRNSVARQRQILPDQPVFVKTTMASTVEKTDMRSFILPSSQASLPADSHLPQKGSRFPFRVQSTCI